MKIACIVEGHGDAVALPILIGRFARDYRPDTAVTVLQPHRIPRGKLVKELVLGKAVELAARQVGATGGILVVLDADDDCPAKLGTELLRVASSTRSDRRIGVVVANREFESWFLASAEALQRVAGLSASFGPDDATEEKRNPKEVLTAALGVKYVELIHQPALCRKLDFTAARRARSFDKLCRVLDALIPA